MKKIILFASVLIGVISYAQIPSYVPSNGLVGWWPFNGNANDESGLNHNLIPSGDASLVNDRNGYPQSAFSLSDVNNNSRLEFNMQDYSLVDNFNQGSLSIWVKITSHDITNHYFGFDNMFMVRQKSGSNTQLYLGLLGGTMKLRMHLNGGLPNSGDLISSSSLSLNTWCNIVYTWNGSFEKIYINGVLDNSINSSNSISALNSPNMFCFGSYGGVGSNSTNSILDDIGVWNRALTDQEILALYQGCQMVITTQPSNQSVNVSAGNTTFSVASSASNPTYQWQTNLGLGFQTLSNAGQYNGVNTANLSVSNLNMSNDNQTFRCIINNNGCVDTSDIAILTIIDDASVFEDNATSILISPNPITNQFSISGIEQIVSLTLMDMNGKLVSSFNEKEESHDVSNLKPGMYFLEVRDENQSYMIKVMKD
jgi:hypothetical protein